jgi:carbonic anhydrase
VHVDASRQGTALDGRELWIVEVRGTLSFLSTPRLVHGLNRVPQGQVVEIDLLVDYLDPATEEQLTQWRKRYESGGGHVDIERPGPFGDGGAAGAKSSPVSTRPWMPWSRWQPRGGDRTQDARRRLAAGIREFHRRTADSIRPELEELHDSQHPDAFFLSCTDSRVVPNLLTSSGPGDLFTVRTMGNVAPADASDVSVSAPLLFAVDQLGVPSIVVCGHSGCGAMTAALADDQDDGPVGRWIAHAAPAVEAWREGHPVARAAAEAGANEVDQLAQVNVAMTIDTLRRELGPERSAGVTFVGLFFRVADGTVWMLRDDRFVPLTDAEMSELAGAR